MNILLIDDDAELVAVLTLTLERAGFAVWSAQDAPVALALLDAERPDLVILDAPLRAAPALDLLDQLRQRRQAAVILLTGRGDEDARVAGLERGADGYVTKPFSTRELVARIRAILQHHAPAAQIPAATRTAGPLTLTESNRTITHAGQRLTVTPLEYRLLQDRKSVV